MSANAQEISNDQGAFDESYIPKPPSLEQTAHALHDTVGRYSDKGAPTHVRVWSPLGDQSLLYEMKTLRSCSVDQIQYLLKPLYETA